MRAEEDVARQRLEYGEGLAIVVGDARIRGRLLRFVDQPETGVHIPAPHDHRVERLAALFDLHRPGGATARVAGGFVRNQHGTAQLDLVSIVEHAVDFGLRIGAFAVGEVRRAAAFHDGHVTLHHHVFRTGLLDDARAAGVVIGMRVTDQQDLDVAVFEAELRHALLDERRRALEAGIDEDVALWSDHEVRREILASHVVQAVGNAERRDRGRPVSVALCRRRLTERQCHERKSELPQMIHECLPS